MHELKNEHEFNEALKSSGDKLVLVDFFATWCGPCNKIAHFVQKLEDDANGQYFVFKVDVDEAQDVAEHANITAMPTFVYYKSGKEIARLQGADQSKLVSLLEKHK